MLLLELLLLYEGEYELLDRLDDEPLLYERLPELRLSEPERLITVEDPEELLVSFE